MNYLEYLNGFVKELRSTNSRSEKEEILESWWGEQELLSTVYDNNELEKLFHYVYDYDKQYYVTSANILKFRNSKKYIPQGEFANGYTLWNLLDDLSSRSITGNAALTFVNDFIRITCKNEEEEKLVLDIIDKDLKCGLSEVTINKVIPNLIKTYDVALAKKFEPKHNVNEDWVIERKLDGARIQIIKKNGIIKCFSRKGKEYTTLGKIIEELTNKMPDNTVFDGEVCIVDDNGKESFEDIMKVIKRKDYTIEKPVAILFDMLTLEEFEEGKSNVKYTDRMENLKGWYSQFGVLQTISIINYERFSAEAFNDWVRRVKEWGWEGLMLRKNAGYKAGRTDELLKFKMWQDAEYKVIAIEEGDAQELVNGVMKKIKCVGALVIEHKGNRVGVGTGLSLEQRKLWYRYPEYIVGKTITVKYFSETVDQEGKPSLRFPVLKAIYDGERDI